VRGAQAVLALCLDLVGVEAPERMEPGRRVRWNLSVAALAASWGLIAVVVAEIDLDAVVLVFWRLALAGLTLAGALAVLGRLGLLRLPRDARLGMTAVGAALASHWSLFFLTIKLSSVAVAVLTVYTAPVFLALLAPLFLPEGRSRVALAALVPAAAGIVLIALAGEGGAPARPLALATGLGAAVTYAALVIATKHLTTVLPVPAITFWSYASAAAVLAPFLLTAPRVLPADATEAGALVLLGVVFTALSGFVYVSLLRRVTAQAIGILAFLEPVSAALLAWAILGQELGPAVAAGGVLVVLAGAVVVMREPGEAAVVEAPPFRPLPSARAEE
jgi:drug/metabolite transporter (DMT)-like permease